MASPRARAPLLLAAVLAANVLFALGVVPPRLLFGPEPVAQVDYALHFSRTVAADEFLSRFGRSWGYDPYFMAGYPMGTVFDVNTKLLQVVVSQLHRFGVPLPTGFNLFVFLSVLLPAPMIWMAARNFRASSWEAALSAGIALSLYVLDPEISKVWAYGVITSGMAMYSLPLALSFLYRFTEERRPGWYVAFVVSSIGISLLHPLSFLLFYVPLAIYLVFRAGRTDRALWGALVLIAVGSLAANAFWFVPVLANLRFKTFSGYHWVGDLKALRRDLLGLRATGLRFLVAFLASVGLAAWWRAGRREAVRTLLFPIVSLTALGYVGGELPSFPQLQTYRCNLIAAFFLAIPASTGLGWTLARIRAALPRPLVARASWVAIILVLTVNLVGRNLDRLTPYVQAGPRAYALRTLGNDDIAAMDWLRTYAEGSRRVLVEHWPLGAFVPWRTGLEVIGGPYPLIWLQHNFTNFALLHRLGVPEGVSLFGRKLTDFPPQELRVYLDTYNVGWVVAFSDASLATFGHAAWLRPVAQVGRYRIYENTDPTTPFLKGTGSARADYGVIRVSNASQGELVLKYHWAPFLTTDPPQEIAPQKVLDDPVPFIRLPANSFSDFVVTDGRKESRPPG